MALNLGTILATSASERPDHPALRLDERVLRYADLDRAARGVAASLHARGLGVGDQVGIMIPNLPELVAFVLQLQFVVVDFSTGDIMVTSPAQKLEVLPAF